MINLWFETWEINGIWSADIYANSDFLTFIGEVSSEKEAASLAQAFIRGFRFSRGEVE